MNNPTRKWFCEASRERRTLHFIFFWTNKKATIKTFKDLRMHNILAFILHTYLLITNVISVCGILKMVGPRMEALCPRIDMLKGNRCILKIWGESVCQKVLKLYFQSQFSISKIIRIFLKFIFIEEYQFRSNFFLL